jgi:hypothetical protein
MRLKGRTRPSEAWILTKCLNVGPLLIFSISLVADYKLQIGGLLPGNADNVAVLGEHEAEREDEAKRGVDSDKIPIGGTSTYISPSLWWQTTSCCRLAAGDVLPGNTDDVAVPGEHEAEGEGKAEQGVDSDKIPKGGTSTYILHLSGGRLQSCRLAAYYLAMLTM